MLLVLSPVKKSIMRTLLGVPVVCTCLRAWLWARRPWHWIDCQPGGEMWDIAGRCWRLIGNIGIAARDGLGGNMEEELGGHGVAQYF